MPDMCLCHGTDAEICKKCYRNDKNTKPSPYWQSYFKVAKDKDGKCENYLSLNNE